MVVDVFVERPLGSAWMDDKYRLMAALKTGSGYTGGKTVIYRLAQVKFDAGGKFFTALPHGLLPCL